MRLTRWLAPCVGTALAVFAGSAAALCGPFVDTPGPTGICPSVLWLKNRLITQGCDATNYCPNNSVQRVQMAAFMHRLGNVVVPEVLSAEDSGGALNLQNQNILCRTSALAPRDYFRRLQMQVAMSFEVTGTQEFVVSPAFSDNGSTWFPVGGQVRPSVETGERHNVHLVSSTDSLGAAVGPREFGLIVQKTSTGGNNNLSSWSCHVQLVSRNEGSGTP